MTTETTRNRISFDASDLLLSHIDHICAITGQTRAALVSGVVVEALPDLLARADALRKRHQELSRDKGKR